MFKLLNPEKSFISKLSKSISLVFVVPPLLGIRLENSLSDIRLSKLVLYCLLSCDKLIIVDSGFFFLTIAF